MARVHGRLINLSCSATTRCAVYVAVLLIRMAQGSAGISGSIVLSGAGPFSNEPVSVITDPMQRARTLTCEHDHIKIVNNVKFNITVERYSWYMNSTSEDRFLNATGRQMDLDGTAENQTGMYICKVTYTYAPQPSQPTAKESCDITFRRALFFVPNKIEFFELLKPHFFDDSFRPALEETSSLQIMAGDPLILNCTAHSISPRGIAYQMMWHIGYPGKYHVSAFVIRIASVSDSGIWKCQVANIWGKSMHFFNVTVRPSGISSSPLHAISATVAKTAPLANPTTSGSSGGVENGTVILAASLTAVFVFFSQGFR